MDQLTNLPPLAIVVFGGTLAILVFVRYSGIVFGGIKEPEAKATVAAVIVDPTALNKATEAVEAHTEAVRETNRALQEMAKQMEINREVDRRR